MDVHWRNSMKPVRFLGFDARAAVPFLLLVLHLRLYTLIFACLCTLLFYLFERNGLAYDAAWRAVRRRLLGARRPAHRHQRIRRWYDYQAK